MKGWLIIFSGTSAISGVCGTFAPSTAAIFASALFGLLFLLALCTKAIRGIA
jgi:hypothetical protein